MWFFFKIKNMCQLELELGLEQGGGRRLHNRSSGCKGSGASGSGITDTSRFFAYSWIHWIRPFLLIKTPTHLPRASHSTIPCKAGTLGFSSRTMKEDISPSLCFPSTVLCNYVQCQFFGSLCASKSSGHFLHRRKRMITNQELRVKFPVSLLFTKLCLTFLIRLRTISSTDRVVTWKLFISFLYLIIKLSCDTLIKYLQQLTEEEKFTGICWQFPIWNKDFREKISDTGCPRCHLQRFLPTCFWPKEFSAAYEILA